ncbi:helix-turn-helix domain-containing protein [Pasteurella multocida]|nr:helix-turn-helix domain-containing protein [Pasteurella multocida]
MRIKFKNNSSIGNRIRELREQKKISRNAMAEKLSLSLSALQNWETNQTEPQASMIITLAKELGVSPNYLLTGEDISERILHVKSESPDEMDGEFEWIDDCRDVMVTAGYGGINGDYPNIKKTKIEKSWFHARHLKPKDCAMFLVNGDSMYPTLKDGEEIIVDRSKRELDEGKIFVINHQGAMWVKKVRFNFNGIDLISDNSIYNPINLTTEEANSLLIIGQVVRSHRNF